MEKITFKPGIKRIALTGPESTGKTFLCKTLAERFNTLCSDEYARNYLTNLGQPYAVQDIVFCVQQQLVQEAHLTYSSHSLLFCDTDILNAIIWCDEVFNEIPPSLIQLEIENRYDYYLLCKPDIEWVADPLRRNRHNRKYLFNRFLNELEMRNLPYAIVAGQGDERIKNAMEIVKRNIT